VKTAIYIQDGDVQLVLTPENSFEKDALNSFQSKNIDTVIMKGGFYECQGGWIRQSANDTSLIMRTREPKNQNSGRLDGTV
jgi:hypothetical protein